MQSLEALQVGDVVVPKAELLQPEAPLEGHRVLNVVVAGIQPGQSMQPMASALISRKTGSTAEAGRV
eukprot:scaffold2097_cov30-Prasinocladus_malaysianus.AAC.1